MLNIVAYYWKGNFSKFYKIFDLVDILWYELSNCNYYRLLNIVAYYWNGNLTILFALVDIVQYELNIIQINTVCSTTLLINGIEIWQYCLLLLILSSTNWVIPINTDCWTSMLIMGREIRQFFALVDILRHPLKNSFFRGFIISFVIF